MTHLFNDPAAFADEVLDGFVAAHRELVRRVAGGVVRAAAPKPGEVAVVVAGGAGHYPAFAGLVGPGLAHGAAVGNIFASPSARQICSVASAVSAGAGVLLCYGNYAGDVLHCAEAAALLTQNGVPTRTLAVTDDIASAGTDEIGKRRGIAGDLAVFKAASAAAEAGRSLDEVQSVASRANDRTRSFGVAFSGCTLPGATDPLFTVTPGRMAVGLGIHGEPGIGEVAVPTADALAVMLVSRLLDDLPADLASVRGARVGLVLNGLGTVKHEELFVVYRRVAQLLAGEGVEIVHPEVGEFVTSYDLAGLSLTLFWLDDELERYWTLPVHTAAFRKGGVALAAPTVDGQVDALSAPFADEVIPGSDASHEVARTVLAALVAVRDVIDENAERLGDIDAVAGDGDHGIGMQRGAKAAVDAATAAFDNGAGAGTVLTLAGDAWSDRAGGTSGALWGIGLRAIGSAMGDEDKPDARAVSEGIAAALRGIQQVGKAKLGDKTLVDVLAPASEALSRAVASGQSLGAAMDNAALVAEDAALATSALLPRIGRARPLAEKSRGTPDPGAVSMALAFGAVRNALVGIC
ncbi:dihydroxyacetone kinase family protein [Mycobacterium sp.]|uniref:dihydroxyacetone kinase family protein n=1 Tax=Mycobacterium sp. TaxID=1785 RepID=UPI002D9FA0E4|nr:dihydroxyacetone kinase family protein [Mycobacterium sp.]